MKIEEILYKLRDGKIGIQEAIDKLKSFPYQDIGFAKIDTHRSLRRGFPEAIFCEGKTMGQVIKIVKEMSKFHPVILALRVKEKVYQALKKESIHKKVKYYKEARAIVIGDEPKPKTNKMILVATAGTADIPVAEESFITAKMMGNKVDKLYDVGVAGIHRLFNNKEKLFSANVLIVVAGMEGTLPSIVAGLVSKPVIAVPTSVGYGTSLHGLGALFTMLNSCSPGIAVVNIDNGFGAGYLASVINQMNLK
ncbi:MAG: nickel pincer cofactor biosynthesis protein LarB [bacterium]|nr:nickel pincer cofactor biosynthesis protein LarB [bacterium]